MAKYSKEEARKMLKIIPPALKELIFSPETAETILKITDEYNINDERVTKLSSLVGYCLLGMLSPLNLEKEIKTELNVEENVARDISQKIIRLILYEVKNDLEELYPNIQIYPGGIVEIEKQVKEKEKLEEKEEAKEKEETPPSADIYREPIEENDS